MADEIAGVAELAQGKLGGRPFAVVRGRADLVLPAGDDGPGAAALVRPDGADMFGFGSREAVLRALAGRPRRRSRLRAPGRRRRGGRRHRRRHSVTVATVLGDDLVVVEAGDERTAWAVGVAAYAHGWEVSATASGRRRRSPTFATPYVDSAVVPRPHP